jgi:hypothetical protein
MNAERIVARAIRRSPRRPTFRTRLRPTPIRPTPSSRYASLPASTFRLPTTSLPATNKRISPGVPCTSTWIPSREWWRTSWTAAAGRSAPSASAYTYGLRTMRRIRESMFGRIQCIKSVVFMSRSLCQLREYYRVRPLPMTGGSSF